MGGTGVCAKSLNTWGRTPDFIRPDLSLPLCDGEETLSPTSEGLWEVKYEKLPEISKI